MDSAYVTCRVEKKVLNKKKENLRAASKEREGKRVIRKILISKNGMAAVEAILSVRRCLALFSLVSEALYAGLTLYVTLYEPEEA